MSMFKDQTVWVTGASSGIGEALSLSLARQGARLILSGRKVAELERVATACGGGNRHTILPFDTTDYPALPGIVADAWDRAGGIDVLVNNAGVSQRSLALETSLDVYRTLLEVDLYAPIALSQLVLPRMVARGGGRFITIASVAGKIGAPMRSGYSAAKHGLYGYFDAIRAETAAQGIKVHMVAPGSVKTNVSRNALTANGSTRGTSDEAIEHGMPVAQAVRQMLDGIARGKRDILVAQGRERLAVTMRRFWPEKAFDMIADAVAKGYAQNMRVNR